MAPDDRLSAALNEIRSLVSARDERWPGGAVIGHGEDVDEFNAAQDKLAAQVPHLLAALDGVLARHKPGATLHVQPCPEHRQFIGMDEALVTEARRNCLECVYEEGKACDECHDRDGTLAPWPCPTYRAISAALLGEEAGGG